MAERKQKDYPCPICLKGFAKASSVSKHLSFTKCGQNLAARNAKAQDALESSSEEEDFSDSEDDLAELSAIFDRSFQSMPFDAADIDVPANNDFLADADSINVPAEDDHCEDGLWDNDLESVPDSESEISEGSALDQTDSSFSSEDVDDDEGGPPGTAHTDGSNSPRRSRYRHIGGTYRNNKGRYVVEHPTAAEVVSFDGETARARFGRDIFAKQRKKCLYYPFKSRAEAELALMLDDSGMSNREIDGFLKNDYVSILAVHPENTRRILPG